MFGFGKKRLAALQTVVEDTRAMMANAAQLAPELCREQATTLRDAIGAVSDHDLAEVHADPSLEALLNEARRLLTLLAGLEKQADRRARQQIDAQVAPALIARLRLQRCPLCDATGFYVRPDVRVETSGSGLDLAVIVCAGCGDLRLRAKSPEALAALADDRDFRYVELRGSGPFRG